MAKINIFLQRCLAVYAAALVCAALFVPVAKASEVEVTTTEDTSAEVTDLPSTENHTQEDTGFDPNNVVSVEIVRSSSPVSPSETNGLKKILLQLIGDYDMVTCEYTYTSQNGYTSKQVTTEPDYSWMITAALFIMVLWSLFRFVGGIVNGKR